MALKIYKSQFLFFSLSLALFFIFTITWQVSASEGAFVELEIEEKKESQSLVVFILEDANILYGNYDNLVNFYHDEYEESEYWQDDYTLTAYNKELKELDKYSLRSSRFVFWDDFENQTGSIVENEEGIISAVIFYDNTNPPLFIKIKDNINKTETDFIYLPAKKLESQFNQINYCKQENEIGIYFNDNCCFGLTPVDYAADWFVCINNEDGICSEFENYLTSPEDCEPFAILSTQNPILSFLSKIWSWLLAGISFPFRFLRALF